MEYKVGIIMGDGIGKEIVTEAIRVLERIGYLFDFSIHYVDLYLGGASIDRYGVPITESTIELAKTCDCILMGSIGGDPNTSPWYKLEPEKRPEAGLLRLRKELGLFANIRPIYLYDSLKASSPLKESILENGIDMLIVRELTGGLYFGEKKTYTDDGIIKALDTLIYNESEIERIAKLGFELASKRRGRLLLVDKANVLETSRLWRSVVSGLSREYPNVNLEYMFVDSASMKLISKPHEFDVILTENMFGDILSDEASVLTGSLGMLPSASLGSGSVNQFYESPCFFGLYEPAGGSAPDIAGLNIANPIAAILSVEMMLRYSLNNEEAASCVQNAVNITLRDGYRTKDLIIDGDSYLTTKQMTDKILERMMK